jgi:hypothetical protein
MFLVALEDSVLLQLDFENEQKLKSHSHKFETFFRTAAERGFTFLQRRITSSHTLTAEQGYEEFVNELPKHNKNNNNNKAISEGLRKKNQANKGSI